MVYLQEQGDDDEYEYEEYEEEVEESWVDTTAAAISAASTKLYGWASVAGSYGGKAAWVVGTSAIMVGFPLLYSVDAQNPNAGMEQGGGAPADPYYG